MDDLFYYGLNRVEELIGDMDKITRVQIRENLRTMTMGYNMQKNRVKQAHNAEIEVCEKYKALKEQLKSSETSNDQRQTTND